MYVYAILVLIWFVLENRNDKNIANSTESYRFSYALKLALPLVLIMGLRHYFVGSDTEQYANRFELSKDLITNPGFQFEVGYNYLNYLSHDILHLSFQFFLLFTSAFYCTVLAKFVSKYSNNITLSFFLHLTIGIFTMSMSGIRQSLAISLCIMGLIIVRGERFSMFSKYGLALLFNIIAYTFHNSSLIFIPFLFLTNMRLTRKSALFLIVLGFSSHLFKSVIAEFGSLYLPIKYEEMSFATNYAANILVYIVPIAISLFCWYFSRTEEDGKYSKLISLMFIFVSCSVFFTNLMELNNQLGRLSYYFIYSYYILIPYAFSSMAFFTKKILQPIIIGICAAFFIIGSLGDIMHIDEFHFFWEDFVWKAREYNG